MTKITVSKYRIISTGHAGVIDDDGIARLCCAISTLMYTYETALDVKGIDHTVLINDGFMDVDAHPKTDDEEALTETIFNTIVAGLTSLSLQYTDNITIRKEG